jgi:Flp pilus assembly pilin Flp
LPGQVIPDFMPKMLMARIRGVAQASALTRGRSGQDLVEYALLAALVGIVAVAAIPNIEAAISTAYSFWNTGTQDLWRPPNPGAGS